MEITVLLLVVFVSTTYASPHYFRRQPPHLFDDSSSDDVTKSKERLACDKIIRFCKQQGVPDGKRTAGNDVPTETDASDCKKYFDGKNEVFGTFEERKRSELELDEDYLKMMTTLKDGAAKCDIIFKQCEKKLSPNPEKRLLDKMVRDINEPTCTAALDVLDGLEQITWEDDTQEMGNDQDYLSGLLRALYRKK